MRVLPMAAMALCGAGMANVSADDFKAPRKAEVKINRFPKAAFDVTMRFADLPFDVSPPKAWVHFKVSNLDCVASDPTLAPGGIRLAPEHGLELTVDRRDDRTFGATLHTDALQDSNLFGLGACHWILETLTVQFSTPTTTFVGTLWADRIAHGIPETLHYLVRDLTNPPPVYDKIFGETAGHYLEKWGPQFTLTLTAQPKI